MDGAEAGAEEGRGGQREVATERRLLLQTASLKEIADVRENELNQLREFCEAERTAAARSALAVKLEATRMRQGYEALKELIQVEGVINTNRKGMLEAATRVIANVDGVL
jgi:nitrate reductase NapAB chaperone NapD